VEAFGAKTITLSSGRIIKYGDCTNLNGINIQIGRYISWKGITLKGDHHAHHIYGY
jgi:hypothetical protein